MALDPHRIQKKVFDSTANKLKAESHGSASAGGTDLSVSQIWKRIFNSSTGKIRTTFV